MEHSDCRKLELSKRLQSLIGDLSFLYIFFLNERDLKLLEFILY